MAIISWKDAYSVGISEIDRQHHKIIDLINQLNDAMTEGKGKAILGKILADLISYTHNHFKAEEKLFDQYEYPEAEEHKIKHQKMTEKVLDLQKQFKEKKISITFEVMDFLQNWLDKHILGTDKKYGPYLNGKGVK
jgi:hemerythrin